MVGWSFIIKAASWHLASPYTQLLAKIHNTYSTNTYNFKWPVLRTHASAYCFNLHIQLRISSTGPCHVLKTRMYTSTGPYHTYKYAVLGSSQFNTLNLCVLAYVFSCRPKRSMLTYVTAIYRRYNPYRLTCSMILYCDIVYLYQVLL